MNKTRNSVLLLLAVTGMATVSTSSPELKLGEYHSTMEPDFFAAMKKVLERFQAQNKEILDNQEFKGPVEMHFNGFTAVIKTIDELSTKDVSHGSETAARAHPENVRDPRIFASPQYNGWESNQIDRDESSYSEEDNPSAQTSSEAEYQRKGGSLYKFHVKGTDWQTAKSTCEREGAHLAIVNSEDEAQMLADMFLSKRRNAFYTNQMWVGVSDIAEEGDFVTIHGDSLSGTGYEKWLENQPDDWRVEDPLGEDCVTMTDDKLLNDVHCSANIAYICEIDEDVPRKSMLGRILNGMPGKPQGSMYSEFFYGNRFIRI